MIDIVRRAAERAAPGARLEDDDDLLDSGAVDSMGFVGILSTLEQQSGVANLGSHWPAGKPRSIRVIAELLSEAVTAPQQSMAPRVQETIAVGIGGWAAALGSRVVTAEALDTHYGLPRGAIGPRTGLESVAWAAEEENEVKLAERACSQALRAARDDVDLLVATSETFLGYPSLAATLHSALLLPEGCWALDVGGGCLGWLNGLAVARGLLSSGARTRALVVAADVHSRRFAGTTAPWQLACLFGDGAGALLIEAGECAYTLGEFVFGCTGAFASAIRIAPGPAGDLDVEFHGERLAEAALGQLTRLIGELEIRTGIMRAGVDGFALHEPNPRALDLLARRAGIPSGKLAHVARRAGNLGSATCAVAVAKLLDRDPPPRSIFLASLGPGLLWGGSYIRRSR